MPRWGVAAAILLVVLLLLVIWSLLRRHPAHLGPVEMAPFTELLPSIAGATQGQIVDGNTAEIIQDAAFFDRLIADVQAAEESVHFETYVWWRGEVCRQLAAAFVRAARRGVTVRLLVDAFGSHRMDGEVRRSMVEAGVSVHDYHPLRLVTLGTVNNRDHRKTAVIDGEIGYLFGHGVAEEWDDVGPLVWKDTAVRIRGPLVASLQSVFLDNWIPGTGEVPTGEEVFPELEEVGTVRGHVVMSSTNGTFSIVELLYKLAIASAREEILIQTPYFVPDTAVVQLLTAAVRRGVRVRLMLPGTEATDAKLVTHAGHTRYRDLLDGGVEILEFEPTLLHKKILIIDRVWSHVGSSNFDSRSLEINDEVSVGLLDREIAEILVREFEVDARHCRVVDPDSWNRSWAHQWLDRSAAAFQKQL